MILIGSRFDRPSKFHFGVYHMLWFFLLDKQVALCHTIASIKQTRMLNSYVSVARSFVLREFPTQRRGGLSASETTT